MSAIPRLRFGHASRDWPTPVESRRETRHLRPIFPNATCATALIDRVIHHADVIAIEGESYRVRDAQQSAKSRRPEKHDSEQHNDTDDA